MPKLSDRDRILRLLSEAEGLSNIRIKTELNLSDDRYDTVRDELLQDNLIEKYVCRGGGIRLTRKGEKESPSYDGGAQRLKTRLHYTSHLSLSSKRKRTRMGSKRSFARPTH